jgi:hypothetical protein
VGVDDGAEPELKGAKPRLSISQYNEEGAVAAIKCMKCSAVVTLQLLDSEVKITHGESFRSKCKEVGNTHAADFVSVATECAAMQISINRTLSRLRHRRAS